MLGQELCFSSGGVECYASYMDRERESIGQFESLPQRIFVDSSTLQTLQVYGEFVYENVRPAPDDRIYSIPQGYEGLDALRAIFFVGKRAPFELALSRHSFEEVAAEGEHDFLQWAYEVLAYWEGCLATHEAGDAFRGTGTSLACLLDGPAFGYLSAKDRALLKDALALECDAFLTLDRKLAKNANHLHDNTGIRVLLPSRFWELLKPWARLFV